MGENVDSEVLLALARWAEVEDGGTRGLDADIELAIGNWMLEHHQAWWNYEAAGESANPPMYAPVPPRWFTASLDAAMTLVPRHAEDQIGWQVKQYQEGTGCEATVWCEGPSWLVEGEAATPALALTAAALRARAAHLNSEHNRIREGSDG